MNANKSGLIYERVIDKTLDGSGLSPVQKSMTGMMGVERPSQQWLQSEEPRASNEITAVHNNRLKQLMISKFVDCWMFVYGFED